MATHDRYDTDILKALQRIATSLDKIEKHLADKDKFEEKINKDSSFTCSECKYLDLYSDEEPCNSCHYGNGTDEDVLNFQRKEKQND